MKTKLFALFLLCSSAAFGQTAAGALSSEPQITQFATHPARAEHQAMADEQNLWGSSPYAYGHGERPLWEVAPVLISPSLGEVARTLKKEHESLKKAEVVWTN
jgi:hypothetical protein